MNARQATVGLLLSMLITSGCATVEAPPAVVPSQAMQVYAEPVRASVVAQATTPEPAPPTPVLYSFVIAPMDVREALRQFSRAYGLPIVIDNDVTGSLQADFSDVPLEQALSLMLSPLDYYWEREGDVIRVRSWATHQFDVNYLRLTRSGAGVTTATVSSSAEAGSSSGGGDEGEQAGSIVIEQSDEIQFWSELEAQITALLSEAGTVVVNRLSGTVLVSDQYARVRTVKRFIDGINRAIHRQVEIQVEIVEVALDSTQALGVDWSRIAAAVTSGVEVGGNIAGRVGTPAGGITLLNDVLNLSVTDVADNGDVRFSALIAALEQQGEVEIVSQPRIRTLNNQTSMIKVGTDRTFFRREQNVDSTSAGSISTATDVPQVVTEGVVLSITPQIGADGWVMMDVSPVVTRVSSVAVVENDNGVVQSSAPNLDVAQISSLIRARSGETVVIGGLIQSFDSDTQRGLPGLTRTGLLGRLFGGRYHSTVRKELIMVLTPTIVPGGQR